MMNDARREISEAGTANVVQQQNECTRKNRSEGVLSVTNSEQIDVGETRQEEI